MSVAKAVARGVLIAGWLGSTAWGGPMLVLGTYSHSPAPEPFAAAPAPTPIRLGYSDRTAAPAGPSARAAFVPPPAAYTPPPAYVPPAPAPAPMAAPFAPPAPSVYDAYINLRGGPFADAATLAVGNPRPWYESRQVAALYGGVPDARQRGAFSSAVLQRVGQTFQQSGVDVNLTDDPTAAAAHTLSVVSHAVNGSSPRAIGMTYLGGNGFHYIDNAAPSARTVDQLQWIVAHNIAHELMLAFNVPEVHDATGGFIDARDASWRMMVNPEARFSDSAARDLRSRDFLDRGSSRLLIGAQLLEPSPVPEPTTVALWGLGAGAFLVARRRPGRLNPARRR